MDRLTPSTPAPFKENWTERTNGNSVAARERGTIFHFRYIKSVSIADIGFPWNTDPMAVDFVGQIVSRKEGCHRVARDDGAPLRKIVFCLPLTATRLEPEPCNYSNARNLYPCHTAGQIAVEKSKIADRRSFLPLGQKLFSTWLSHAASTTLHFLLLFPPLCDQNTPIAVQPSRIAKKKHNVLRSLEKKDESFDKFAFSYTLTITTKSIRILSFERKALLSDFISVRFKIARNLIHSDLDELVEC